MGTQTQPAGTSAEVYVPVCSDHSDNTTTVNLQSVTALSLHGQDTLKVELEEIPEEEILKGVGLRPKVSSVDGGLCKKGGEKERHQLNKLKQTSVSLEQNHHTGHLSTNVKIIKHFTI